MAAAQVAHPATVEDTDERGHAIPSTKMSAHRGPAPDTASHVTSQTFATLASSDSAKVLPCVPEVTKEKIVTETPAPAGPPPPSEAMPPPPRPSRSVSPEKRHHKRTGSKTSKRSSSYKNNPVHGYDGLAYPVLHGNAMPAMPAGEGVPTPMPILDQYGQPMYSPHHQHYAGYPYPHSPPTGHYDPYQQPMLHYTTAPQSPIDQAQPSHYPYPYPYAWPQGPAMAPQPADIHAGMPPQPFSSHHRRPMSFHAGVPPYPRDHIDPYAYPFSPPYHTADPYGAGSYRQDYFGPMHPQDPAIGAPATRQALPSSKSHRRRSLYDEQGAARVTFDDGHGQGGSNRATTTESTGRAKRSSREYQFPAKAAYEDFLRPSRAERPTMRHAKTYDDSERKHSRDSRRRSYTESDTRRAPVFSRDPSREERRSRRRDEDLPSRRSSRTDEARATTKTSSHSISPRRRESRSCKPAAHYENVEVQKRAARDDKDSSKDAEVKAERYMQTAQGGEYKDIIADTLRDSYDAVKPVGMINQKGPTIISRSSSSKHSHGRRASEVTKASSRNGSDVRIMVEVHLEDGTSEWRHATVPKGPDGHVAFRIQEGGERNTERERERDRDRDRAQDRGPDRDRDRERERAHDPERDRDRDRDRERRREAERERNHERQPTPPERSESHRHERSHSLSSRLSKLTGFSRNGRSRTGSDLGRNDDYTHSRRRSTARSPIYEDSRGERREERRERRRGS